MVHLADAGIAGQEIGPVRVHERVVGRDANGVQHGLHVVGQALAVAETGLMDLTGRERLVTADAQLDAHVARMLAEVVIQNPDLLQIGTGLGCHLLQFGPEGFREVVRPFAESMDPGALMFPGGLAAVHAGIGEIRRAGEDIGHDLPPGGHEHLGGIALEDRHFPAVGIGLAGFFPHIAHLGRDAIDFRAGRNLEGVGGLLHLDFLAGYRKEGREGSDAFPVGDRVFVGNGERICR